ncbi:biotin/lipoyl-binding protein [Variovorax sp. LjRoot84]|uniref:efflux RND transporter periplasmic adaptor subunit n=1 Tax=Variovorax sp. LjRoot84 TaxID=3342340 RepID=UPI003ED05A0D
MISARKLVTPVVALLLASGAAALAYRAASEPNAAAPSLQARPDPLVAVTPAQRTDLPIRIATEGHVTPLAQVDIRAQMSGAVLQVHFREGDELRAGQLLFTLDASEAEAQLARVQAVAANAHAQAQEALREHRRAVELGRANFVSPSAIDTAAGKVESLKAVLAAAEAEVRSARIAVQRSRIVAPAGGAAQALARGPECKFRRGTGLFQPASVTCADTTTRPR